MEIRWHGHSCIELTAQGKNVLIDPYINGNQLADQPVSAYQPDYILVTHAHHDHVGDTVEIAKNSGATVIAVAELATYFGKQGLNAIGMNQGGSHQFDFGTLKLVPALHSSGMDIGGTNVEVGVACGFVISSEEKVIYDAGDTALFSDMSLIGRVGIDLAFLPIGDYFTMGIDDALMAAALIQAKKVIPIHYNTFSQIEQNPQDFISGLPAGQGKLPKIGEKISI